MLQLITDAILTAIIFLPITRALPIMRGVFIAWIAFRTIFYLGDPRFSLVTRFLSWRFKGRDYKKQLLNFINIGDNSLASRLTSENTIICGENGFPAAALFVAVVAHYCGSTEWKRIRVPSNYFGSGMFEAQLLRVMRCEPIDFYERLNPGEIAFMARGDLRSHPAIMKELKKQLPDRKYVALQCSSLPATGFIQFIYIFDAVDDFLFDWQSPQLIAGLAHLFKIYMITEPVLDFLQLTENNK